MSDDLLKRDLATVGRASRARSIALDATLATVGATPVAARTYVVSARDAMLVTASRLYAARVAWMAAGTLMVLFYVARFLDVLIATETLRDDLAYTILWRHTSLSRVTAVLVGVALLVNAAARRTFLRAVTASSDPHATARSHVDAVERWSFAATVAGGGVFLGMLMVTFRHFDDPGFNWNDHAGYALWPVGFGMYTAAPLLAATALVVAGATVLARRRTPHHLLWLVAGARRGAPPRSSGSSPSA